MSIIPALISLYRGQGLEIACGLNPANYDDLVEVSFTWLIRDGHSVTSGLGIAQTEVFFLESLTSLLKPESIFVIGNSFGWSTLALGLMCPNARVVAIDAGVDRNAVEGLKLTNKLAAKAGLDVKAVLASSPQDVEGAVQANLKQPIDFAFVDGLHTNEQVVLDVDALYPHLSETATVVLHDVVSARLQEGVSRIEQRYGTSVDILDGTPSGMGILQRRRSSEMDAFLDAFKLHPDVHAVIEAYRIESRRLDEPRLLRRLKRTFNKHVPFVHFDFFKPASFHDGSIGEIEEP